MWGAYEGLCVLGAFYRATPEIVNMTATLSLIAEVNLNAKAVKFYDHGQSKYIFWKTNEWVCSVEIDRIAKYVSVVAIGQEKEAAKSGLAAMDGLLQLPHDSPDALEDLFIQQAWNALSGLPERANIGNF